MPIRPELRHHYSGRAWRETRTRILARAKQRCEQCGKPNACRVFTLTGVESVTDQAFPFMFWTKFGLKAWRDSAGQRVPAGAILWRGLPRPVYVVLTVAHLNHVAGDDRDENLKALCQWCHLNYDKLHHAETRASRKDAARPLLKEAI